MTADELKQLLQFICNDDVNKFISIFVTVEDSNPLLLNIRERDKGEIIDALKDFIQERILNYDFILQDYSVTNLRVDTYYRYDLDADTKTPEMVNLTSIIGVANQHQLDPDVINIEKADGMYFKLSDANGHIVTLYRHLSVADLTFTNSSHWYTFSGNIFSRQHTSLLKISPEAQMLQVSDEIILLNMKRLERLLKLDAILKRETETHIQTIQNKGIVESTAKLLEVCKQPSISKKLRHAMTESKVFLNNLTNENIINFASRQPKLKFKFNPSKTKFRLKSKAEAERFIKLLDDDYLRSLLTNEDYDSNDKTGMP